MVPDLLDASELEQVHVLCVELLAAPPAERRVGDKPAAGTRHLVELDDRSEMIAQVIERPALMEIVTSIVGADPILMQAGYRSPQPSYGGQRLHADDQPKLDDSGDRVATALIALVDFTESNGSTRVVPGSHRRADLQRSSGSLEHHPDERHLVGSAGSAFVFSGHLLHAGSTNGSKTERPALQIVWRRGGTIS